MNNMKLTRKALLSSALALVLCFAMLLGTTYAWFTDSVTSTGNIIQTGVLDVTLEYKTPTDTTWQDASQGAIFNYDNWEPGYTEVRYVKVENVGSLALKFTLTIVPNAVAGDVDLAEVIDVYMFAGETAIDRDDLTADACVGTVAALIADLDGAAHGELVEDESEIYTIVLKMNENAGNEYQGLSLGGGFSVNLLATQLTSESDSFGTDYDADANYSAVGSASAPVSSANSFGRIEIPVFNADTTTSSSSLKVATVIVPEVAVDPNVETINVFVKEELPLPQSNFNIEVAGEVKTFEVTVEGIVDGNTNEIEVWLYVGTGLNVGNVVYHTLADGSVETLSGTYDSNTGNVRFKTTSFSPFSVIVYDEPFVPSNTDIPQSKLEELEGEDIKAEYTEWLADGVKFKDIIEFISPETLDAFYRFTALDTEETVVNSKYANWKCDFFVKVNKKLPVESIILGGYYSQFGAAAFTNSVEVEGEQWVPLLLLVSGGWTYQDIVCGVGEFVCGVKDVESGFLAENGYQITVQLRLVDPDFQDSLNLQEDEYIVINEVVYDFASGESDIRK